MTPSPHSGDWQGQTMLDRGGEKIGTIEEIYLVEETGRPEWALVKMGLVGRRTTLVPISDARPTAEGVRAGYEKSLVSDAPAVDPGADPPDELVAAIYRH